LNTVILIYVISDILVEKALFSLYFNYKNMFLRITLKFKHKDELTVSEYRAA